MRPAAALVLLLLCGCDDRAVLEISLFNRPASVTALSIGLEVATSPNQPPTGYLPQPLSGNDLQQVDVRLPIGATGPARVQVDGLSSGGCVEREGSGMVDVMGTGHYPLNVPLLAPQEAGCSVAISTIGGGGGTVVPVGTGPPCDLSPGPCRWPFPSPGLEVQLIAEADSSSAFLGFSGDCVGGNPCVLRTAARARAVQVGFAPRHACTAAGWCWERPLPAGDQLSSVFALAESDVWAVGEGGTVLHSTGAFFAPVALPAGLPARSFTAVWGRSANEVYISGKNGTLLRWDGSALSLVPTRSTAQLQAVTGSGSEILVAGFSDSAGQAVVLRQDAQLGAFIEDKSLPAGVPHLWGARAFDDQVVLVGDQGTVLRRIGGVWRHVDAPTPHNLKAIWGHSSDDFWVVDDAGTVHHAHNGQWTEVALPGEKWTGVSGLGEEVWISSASGSLWRVLPGGPVQQLYRAPGSVLTSVFAAGPRRVFAVGSGGSILRYNGTQVDQLAGGFSPSLRALHVINPDDIWAVGDLGALWHYQAGGWQAQPSAFLNDYQGVWASGKNDLWIVGSRALILHSDNMGVLHPVDIISAEGLELLDPDGKDSLFSVYGTGPGEVWAVGNNGLILHLTAGVWNVLRKSVVTNGTTHLVTWNSGWSSGGLVWMTGSTDEGIATILHVKENSAVVFPAGWQLRSVRGQGNRLYAVGQANGKGLILSGDGTAGGWRVDRQDLPQPLTHVESAGDFYATGEGGLILHLKGGEWQEEASGASNALFDLRRDSTGKRWAVGEFGAILSKGL